jgi:tetratricopeptide (TPR) repeat protein
LEHSETASAQADIGKLWRATGQFADARSHFERALSITERIFGPDHATTAEMALLVSVSMTDTGDLAGALLMAEHSAHVQERVYGRMNCKVITTFGTIAWIHNAMGQPEKAMLILERVVSTAEKQLNDPMPPDRVCLANRYSDLGSVNQRMGRYAMALQSYDAAARLYTVALGAQNLAMAENAARRADLYVDLGQNALGIGAARRGLEITEKLLGRGHPTTASALRGMARALSASGEHGEALSLLKEADAIFVRAFGADDHKRASGLMMLAQEHQRVGQGEQIPQLADRAVAIEERFHGVVTQ